MSRCEPPAALRGKSGWHWVQPPKRPWENEPEAVFWRPVSASWSNPVNLSPSEAWERGHRYLRPVPTPDELDGLVRAARSALAAMSDGLDYLYEQDNCAACEITLQDAGNALAAALAAPAFKESGDGE